MYIYYHSIKAKHNMYNNKKSYCEPTITKLQKK